MLSKRSVHELTEHQPFPASSQSSRDPDMRDSERVV